MPSSSSRVAIALLLALGKATEATLGATFDGSPEEPQGVPISESPSDLHFPNSTPSGLPMGPPDPTSVEAMESASRVLQHHETTTQIFTSIWNAVGLSYGTTFEAAKGALGEAKRSEYLLAKQGEMDVAVDILVAAVEQNHSRAEKGEELIPAQEMEALKDQAKSAASSYFNAMKKPPQGFTKEFYLQNPPNPKLDPSQPHPKPTKVEDLVQLMAAVNKAVDAEAAARRRKSEDKTFPDEAVQEAEEEKMKAITRLHTAATNNKRAAEAYITVAKEMAASSSRNPKQREHFKMMEVQWKERLTQAEEAVTLCRALAPRFIPRRLIHFPLPPII